MAKQVLQANVNCSFSRFATVMLRLPHAAPFVEPCPTSRVRPHIQGNRRAMAINLHAEWVPHAVASRHEAVRRSSRPPRGSIQISLPAARWMLSAMQQPEDVNSTALDITQLHQRDVYQFN